MRKLLASDPHKKPIPDKLLFPVSQSRQQIESAKVKVRFSRDGITNDTRKVGLRRGDYRHQKVMFHHAVIGAHRRLLLTCLLPLFGEWRNYENSFLNHFPETAN